MTRAVRFASVYARMRALKSTLWSPADLALLLEAGTTPEGGTLSSQLSDVMPPLARWYATLTRFGEPVASVLLPLVRLHEIENVKLLWRAAVHDAPLENVAWRPLGALAQVSSSWPPAPLEALTERLARTPYGPPSQAIFRSHASDLAAAELGFDRWASGELFRAAKALSATERDARELLIAVCRERDVDLLRRGGPAFGLEPDLVAKSTIALALEHRIDALTRVAAWTPAAGPLSSVLPASLRRLAPDARDWTMLATALRRTRLTACRRTFTGWPFRLGPIVAATMLRDEQARATLSLAAAREVGARLHTALSLALAASPLES